MGSKAMGWTVCVGCGLFPMGGLQGQDMLFRNGFDIANLILGSAALIFCNSVMTCMYLIYFHNIFFAAYINHFYYGKWQNHYKSVQEICPSSQVSSQFCYFSCFRFAENLKN